MNVPHGRVGLDAITATLHKAGLQPEPDKLSDLVRADCPQCHGADAGGYRPLTVLWREKRGLIVVCDNECTTDEVMALFLGDEVILEPIPEFPVEVLPPEARTLVQSAVENGLPAALVAGA